MAAKWRSLGAAGIVAIIPLLAVVLKVPWEPSVSFGYDRNTALSDTREVVLSDAYERHLVSYECADETCRGWLYLPNHIEKAPVVIVCTGLGTTKDSFSQAWAGSFAHAGIASLVFDFRHWGASGGGLDHYVSPQERQEDIVAAIAHVKACGLAHRVDSESVALLGISLGGGDALIAASRHNDALKAYVGLVPLLDPMHKDAQKPSLSLAARLASVALADVLRGIIGLPRLYIDVVASPQSTRLSLVQTPVEDLDKFLSLFPPERPYANKLQVGSCLAMAWPFRPAAVAPSVTAPALFLVGDRDHVCPLSIARQTFDRLASADKVFHVAAGTHSACLHQPEVLPLVTTFLATRLGAAPLAPPAPPAEPLVNATDAGDRS